MEWKDDGRAGPAAMVAVDWGTSSFRAALLDAEGTAMESREAPLGITRVPEDSFREILLALLKHWRAQMETLPVYLCGMVGSRKGWKEVPYVPCPGDAQAVARGVLAVEDQGLALRFVPGMHVARADGGDDVMRGEETQAIGAGEIEPGRIVVTPGTHSKWIRMLDGEIRDFSTFMTGDLYQALASHTILAASAGNSAGQPAADAGLQAAAFAEGVNKGFSSSRLSRSLFGVRTRALFGGEGFDAAEYLSGLLLGDELAEGLRTYPSVARHGIRLVGSAALAQRYEQAAALVGIDASQAVHDASFKGCHLLARLRGEI